MRGVFFLCSCLLVASCAPVSVYYREGVSLQKMERDEIACAVDALQDVPVTTATRTEPPRYVPARHVCNADGRCYTRGGYFLPGRTYSVDTNAKLRARVKRLCMTDQGYIPVDIPICPPRVEKAVPTQTTAVFPRLTGSSCAIRNGDGSIQIVAHPVP